MSSNTKTTTAITLALLTAVLSGGANVINKISVTVLANPVAYTTLKNGLVALAIIGILLMTRRWKEITALRRQDWWRLLAIGVIGGSVPFILFFTGLTMTSAVSASLIHKTLFIWVALLAVPLLKERVGWLHLGAFLLLAAGSALLGGLQQLRFGTGELMILGATVLWALENVIAKKTLANVSSVTVAGSRMVFGSMILLAVTVWQGHSSLLTNLTSEQWYWTALPVLFLTGYVLCWYAALQRAPATFVSALLVPAALVTNVLSAVFLDKTLSATDITSGILMLLAVGMLLLAFRRSAVPRAYAITPNR